MATSPAPDASPLDEAELAPHNVPRSVKGGLTLKALVSKKKLRFVDGAVDLDLSYITNQLIAMGYPSHGLEAWYRNPALDVRRFLEARHGGHFRIWNLCSERAYGPGHFDCQVERYSWADHTPPPLSMVRGLYTWQTAQPSNGVHTAPS
jgi:phosphatidylinositol-3,4,5-trisphosphate 3-phosphatase/dual-specificity protein phosphatase PTEN